MAKKVNKEYLEKMEKLLAEVLAGNIPPKHKDGIPAYVQYLKKEILLASRSGG